MQQTLSQYLAGLRESVEPYPPLARERVKAMTDDLLVEPVRLRWGTNCGARKVAHNTRDEWNAYYLR